MQQHRRKRKQHQRCETYRFLLLILNTSFCSSCTKRKNSLIWALIDISSIFIRSTLAGCYYYNTFFFCSFIMMWLIVTEITLIVSIQKKKGKRPVPPHTFCDTQYLHNLYKFCFRFLFLCGVKICRLSQRRGRGTKREENGRGYYVYHHVYNWCR